MRPVADGEGAVDAKERVTGHLPGGRAPSMATGGVTEP
jgi:hypothetical protein